MNFPTHGFVPERIENSLSKEMKQVAQTLMETLHLKDAYTAGHGFRVGAFTEQIARTLNIGERDTSEVVLAATLHDIGKVGIPDGILLKSGPLTSAEWTVVRRHPEFGWWSLRHIEEMENIGLMLLHHHEYYNGCGYPLGLAAEQIPLGARIIAVADAFDAMTTNRSDRRGMPRAEAIQELLRFKGTQFDPGIVDAFLSDLPQLP
jgi:HD-GYP domain-containing protein (c-di-GMP phosphodiesterase class II)